MPFVWKKMFVPVLKEVMCIIDHFVEEAPPGNPPCKKVFLSLIHPTPPLDEITKIKICHMVANEHPGVIGGEATVDCCGCS